jgi:hypothetical protein
LPAEDRSVANRDPRRSASRHPHREQRDALGGPDDLLSDARRGQLVANDAVDHGANFDRHAPESHDQPIRGIFGTAFCANFICACRVLRLRGANNPCVGLDLRQRPQLGIQLKSRSTPVRRPTLSASFMGPAYRSGKGAVGVRARDGLGWGEKRARLRAEVRIKYVNFRADPGQGFVRQSWVSSATATCRQYGPSRGIRLVRTTLSSSKSLADQRFPCRTRQRLGFKRSR